MYMILKHNFYWDKIYVCILFNVFTKLQDSELVFIDAPNCQTFLEGKEMCNCLCVEF